MHKLNKIKGNCHAALTSRQEILKNSMFVRRKGRMENGRSMVEMLGVLAIIGVLSIVGIFGLKNALEIHKANEAYYDLTYAMQLSQENYYKFLFDINFQTKEYENLKKINEFYDDKLDGLEKKIRG